MTEPLIDVDELIDAYWSGTHEDAKDRVMDYLRSVLTPEALDPIYGPDHEDHEDGTITVRATATGAGLHRRIFGEDQ